jgi:flagellar biosynthesis/type III secretory pathway M-ring protein FliF/YscJ
MPMYGYGFLIGIVLVLIVWFLLVAPMERRMHQRKMELMKRKLERNEERLRNLKANERNNSDGKKPASKRLPSNDEHA